MNGKHSEHKHLLKVGPGGMRCACCGPAPGKDRRRAKRAARRRGKQAALREARAEAAPDSAG